jgi:SAM-dependent methyltransferase
MKLSELQKNWNRFGEIDPLWSILTAPDKIHRKWDAREFFETGVQEVDLVMHYVDTLGIPLSRARALDFGCGVGRLTQALCRHFSECCGVDIAPSMIRQAKKYNRYGARCRYHLNKAGHLKAFDDSSWDFIYSNLVLQHMQPAYSRNYIREFVRILAVNGVLIFQVPAEVSSMPLAAGIMDEALPESGFSAQIRLGTSSLTANTGSPVKLRVTVKNLSAVTWPSPARIPHCPIALGNHWLDAAGATLTLDDVRAILDHDLEPMQETEMDLLVNTPAEPGNYILELDMVQEAIAWFGDKGSEVARVDARIDQDDCKASHEVRGELHPKMEMYGIPKEEVLETITAAGGRTVDVEPDFSAGVEWTSFRYCVTKAFTS